MLQAMARQIEGHLQFQAQPVGALRVPANVCGDLKTGLGWRVADYGTRGSNNDVLGGQYVMAVIAKGHLLPTKVKQNGESTWCKYEYPSDSVDDAESDADDAGGA